MIDCEKILEIAQRELSGTDMFTVSCKCSPMNEVELLIDSDTHVTIERCAELSRKIEAEFDREVEDYELEVGSAGLTSPFKVRGQYEKNIGNEVEVLSRDGRKLHGVLTEVGETTFTIEIEKKVKPEGAKRPVVVTEPIEFGYDAVKSVKYLITFK